MKFYQFDLACTVHVRRPYLLAFLTDPSFYDRAIFHRSKP
jgi:hypothetical protein